MGHPTDRNPAEASLRTAMLQNLAQQSAALDRLFSTIATPQGTANGVVDGQALARAYATLNGTVHSFAGMLENAAAHQKAYRAMLEKQALVDRLERRVRVITAQLERDRAELEREVLEGQEIRRAIERSEANPASIPTLIAHALTMAPHSSAPVKAARPPPVRQPGSGDPVPMAGGAPVPPPYPTESTMRMGLLFAMQGSMSGMGETGKVGEADNAQGQQGPQQAQQQDQQQHTVVHEEPARRFDPEAVFDIGLGSDSEDE